MNYFNGRFEWTDQLFYPDNDGAPYILKNYYKIFNPQKVKKNIIKSFTKAYITFSLKPI